MIRLSLLVLALPLSSALLGARGIAFGRVTPATRVRLPTSSLYGEDGPINTSQPDTLDMVDRFALNRVVRLANHAPALASLSYFGLISSSMMMGMSAPAATLRYVLTRAVGPTSNAAFSALFPTLVTPASFGASLSLDP